MAPELLFLFIQCSTHSVRGHQRGGEEVREISSQDSSALSTHLFHAVDKFGSGHFSFPVRLERDIHSLICRGDDIRVQELEQGEHLLEEPKGRMTELCPQRRLAHT